MTNTDNPILQAVIRRLRDVTARLEKGKGTWPNKDYVRDCDWDSLQGQELALRGVLWDCGFDVNRLAEQGYPDV